MTIKPVYFSFIALFVISVFASGIMFFYFVYGPDRLVKASVAGDASSIEFLCSLGINPDCNAFLIGSPMTCAAAAGNINTATKLLACKADLNFIDAFGLAPLHCAVKYRKKDFITWLIKQGCRINLLSRDKQTAMDIALSESGNQDIIDILKNNGAKTSAELEIYQH